MNNEEIDVLMKFGEVSHSLTQNMQLLSHIIEGTPHEALAELVPHISQAARAKMIWALICTEKFDRHLVAELADHINYDEGQRLYTFAVATTRLI